MTDKNQPLWLPELITLESFNGEWPAYLESIYRLFHRDFVTTKPMFRGIKLRLKRHPEYDGKSATFWHFISEGSNEAQRTPDLRRCERIKWPRAIIENESDSRLKIWSEERNGNKRIHIWFELERYIVVLDDRREYILPWTAFHIEHPHQARKYNKRFERNKDNPIR